MIKKTKQFVYCTFNKEGYHRYPEAANDPSLATGDEMDVSHLAARHMHYFYFKVWVEVNHTNRDIEFIQLRRWLESLYDAGSIELNNKSCEMISDELAEVISIKYPGVDIRIDVAEDNINGSYTEYKGGNQTCDQYMGVDTEFIRDMRVSPGSVDIVAPGRSNPCSEIHVGTVH